MAIITGRDRQILRELAREVAEAADDPGMATQRRRWVEHNGLRSTYPMMLVFPEGSWQELVPDSALRCEAPAARSSERFLRQRLYTRRHFRDDTVIEKEWVVPKVVHTTGWGLEPRRIQSSTERGAWLFDPVLNSAADLKKIQFPEITYDEEASLLELVSAEDLFGDILDVRQVGIQRISYHLMNQYSAWRGLEQTYMDMVLEPQLLHDAMALLEEGHHHIRRQWIEQGLLTPNNDGTYHNSGGNSYTDELPGAEATDVGPAQMWASAEAQELDRVSPEHHEEFCLSYERRLLEPFALTGYGCCDDLTGKMDLVSQIGGMRRVSICPFADVERAAEVLRGDYIFSWKPKPMHLIGDFDEAHIRQYLTECVLVAKDKGCVLEMVLKDTHTCQFQTHRFDAWTRIAREVIESVWGEPPPVD